MADDKLNYMLKNLLVAQKRTSKHKQFVFLNNETVIKGPYRKDRLNLILKRSELLKLWQTPFIVHPLYVEDEWIYYENVAKDYPVSETIYNQESFSNYSYQVAIRNVVDKLNNVLLSNNWVYESVDLLEALVHLWILDVGDTGLFNILVDQQRKLLYVIDYDQTATVTRTGEQFYFSRTAGETFRWFQNMQKHYNQVAERLNKLLLCSPDYQSKILYAIKQLRQYAVDSTTDLSASLGFSKPPEPPEPQWKGMFSSITRGGHKLDEVKSGLQKYIRRGLTTKALYCAFEMYNFITVPEAKAIITNLFNRLKVIAVEDIGIASYNQVIKVLQTIDAGEQGAQRLADIVTTLSECKKTRLASHINAVFRIPAAMELAEKLGITIDHDYSREDLQFIKNHSNVAPFCDIKEINLQMYGIMFYKRILEYDFNAITWCGYYLDHSVNQRISFREAYYNPKLQRTFRSSKAVVHLFEILDLFIDTRIIRAAYFTFPNSKTRDDKKYFLLFGIIAALHGVTFSDVQLIKATAVEDLVNSHCKLELDDYVFDKHTVRGYRKTRADFVKQGALVIPEDLDYHYDNFVKVYEDWID